MIEGCDSVGMNNTSALIKHFTTINGLTENLHSFKYDRYNQCYVNDTHVVIYSKGYSMGCFSAPACFTHIREYLSTTIEPHYKAWIDHWLSLFGDTINFNTTHACIRYSNGIIRHRTLVEYFVFDINRCSDIYNTPVRFRIASFSFTSYNGDDEVVLIAPLL